jgi:hypothetical protein
LQNDILLDRAETLRKRKRDWPITVYKFWARPFEVPQSVWDTAEAMRSLWNALVRLHDDAQFASETLPEIDKTEISKNTEAATTALVAMSGLNWECGPEVIDRFRVARRRAFQALQLGEPLQKAGFPRTHLLLDHVAIPHRFTAGGASVQSLFSNRARRFHLAPVHPEAYVGKTRNHTRQRATTGTFKVGNELIRFRTVLHRQIPSDAMVKKIMWLGNKHPTRGWQWSIAITVEQMSRTWPTRSHRQAAMDLGWRLMQGYVRIGMLYDGRRFYELRCPLNMPSYHTRRHRIESSYYALIDLDHRISENVEKTKAALPTLLPSQVQEDIAWVTNTIVFQRMKQGGLGRLLEHFRVHKEWYPHGIEIDKLLATWKVEDTRQRSMRIALLDRLVARRRWLYRNLAAWLAQNYKAIACKSPPGIKQMIEDRQPEADNKYSLARARRYHQWVAVSELMGYLDEAAAKTGCIILATDPSNTTRGCAECGELIVEDAARLILSCPNGHASDQDVNAARNIFAKMRTDRDVEEGLQSGPEQYNQQASVVPDVLRSVVIEVLPE